MSSTPLPQRYPEIDILRTAAIVMMIVYHAVFDLHAFHGWSVDPFSGMWLALARSTAVLFIALTGASFMISRDKMIRRHTSKRTMTKRWLRRAAIILSCAMLVSIATYVFDPEQYVRFGILHMIAVSILLLPLFAELFELNIVLGIGILLFSILVQRLHHPFILFLPLGITPVHFSSMDYFPLLPWFGVTLIGAGVCSALYLSDTPVRRRWDALRKMFDSLHRSSRLFRALELPGKYSLLLYLIHQPVLIGLMKLIVR